MCCIAYIKVRLGSSPCADSSPSASTAAPQIRSDSGHAQVHRQAVNAYVAESWPEVDSRRCLHADAPPCECAFLDRRSLRCPDRCVPHYLQQHQSYGSLPQSCAPFAWPPACCLSTQLGLVVTIAAVSFLSETCQLQLHVICSDTTLD